MPDELERRRQAVAESADLQALLRRLTERAAPVLARMPVIPSAKALLSADGGICPDDGSALTFDPWSPDRHRCARCGKEWTGERHDRHWARFQHLWLAERAAHLAVVAAFAGNEAAALRAAEILRAYGERYLEYPNRDNVLGPARLFFSTYLESIWITNYLAAAQLLRSAGLLDDAAAERVSVVADEAANLIGEFDEGFSNRQTWHNAALLAIAVWFEDEPLAARALEADTGLATHLVHGFGADGAWYEGENYHLFALQGMLTGIGWARAAGVELMADPDLAGRLHAALRAPSASALPDFTFPARKDSRFGVSLAQPMYLELWETGLGLLDDTDEDTTGLREWLAALYQSPSPAPKALESYLHEAGETAPRSRSRRDLSWSALLCMPAQPAAPAGEWRPQSELVSQGFAILRAGGRYVGLECGAHGGGHGHPDRLNLTLHASGVHWLPDVGTGSYVSPDLFWYRSTLAHNAPRLDGVSQTPADAVCDAYEASGDWAWVRGVFGEVTRTVLSGPQYVLDIVELDAPEDRVLELPWHLAGQAVVDGPADWTPTSFDDPNAHGAARLERRTGVTVIRSQLGAASCTLHLASDAELLRLDAPGAPESGAEAVFYLQRAAGRAARLVSVIDTSDGASAVTGVRTAGNLIEVDVAGGTDRHSGSPDGWTIERGDTRLRLAGRRVAAARFEPLLRPRAEPARGFAVAVSHRPALDGSFDGWDAAEWLLLDHDDQYRRSEQPYGEGDFTAAATVNWDERGLYVAIDVVKADVWFRPPDAPPLRLDNEPDDIHSDGVQVYFRDAGGAVCGVLAVPEENGAVRSRPVSGTAACAVEGGWQPTDAGYRITLGLAAAAWLPALGDIIEFDLVVNEMYPGRERRAGQLVWSGGGGWVWLRGDRQDPERFGELELR